MRTMELNDVEPRHQRPLRRRGKCLLHRRNSRMVELMRLGIGIRECKRTRRSYIRPSPFCRSQQGARRPTDDSCSPSVRHAPVGSPVREPWPWRNSTIRFSWATCSSFQMPRSLGVILPSGSTAAASVKTSPAPPTARLPRCTRCQSLAKPSVLEYWHIGETPIRLESVTARNVIGEKR